jgi:hypothetical protein
VKPLTFARLLVSTWVKVSNSCGLDLGISNPEPGSSAFCGHCRSHWPVNPHPQKLSRLVSALIGFLCVWYLGFGPPTVGILFVAYFASQGQCSINEGGVGACYLFGLDMGTTFHTAASLPWLIFILLPVCGLTSLIYAGIALANLNQRPQSSHPK